MSQLFSLVLVATVLNLLLTELYFFGVRQIKNPKSPTMIIAVWVMFLGLGFCFLLSVWIPMRDLSDPLNPAQKLIAQIPAYIGVIYLLLIRRGKLREIRTRFRREGNSGLHERGTKYPEKKSS